MRAWAWRAAAACRFAHEAPTKRTCDRAALSGEPGIGVVTTGGGGKGAMGGAGTALATTGAGGGAVADGAASALRSGALACCRGAGVALPQPTVNNAETTHVSGGKRIVSQSRAHWGARQWFSRRARKTRAYVTE